MCTNFGVKKVEYLGHLISEKGIEILPYRISAITNFPVPKYRESLMQLLGSVNYVSKYLPNKSHILEPLNSLLKDNTPFEWRAIQQKAFNQIKKLLTNAPTLARYDYSKNIIIRADASGYGLGSALLQENKESEREVVVYASRTLSKTEKKYSQIEKEALALMYAVEHFKDFITGIKITLETDHKPPVQILKTKPLDKLTLRLQRIMMRLMRYDYEVIFVPGKQLVLADCLSRNPVESASSTEKDFEAEIDCYVNFVTNHLPATKVLLQRIKEEQERDVICKKLKEFSLNKWPAKERLPKGLLVYFQLRNSISYTNDLLMISPLLQREILSKVHERHLGISKCRNRVRQSVWWLGLSSQLKSSRKLP